MRIPTVAALAVLLVATPAAASTHTGDPAPIPRAQAAELRNDAGVGLPSRYVVPGRRAYPGGLAYDSATGQFFTGSTQEGTLFVGRPGRERMQVWLPGGADGRTTTSGIISDDQGRLYVGGGPTNRVWIYDIRSRRLLATVFGVPGGFVNDITIAEDGTAYATDSLGHLIYRISEQDGDWSMHPWLDLAGTPVEHVAGHNLNGIIAVDGDKLIAVHSQSGKLYRFDRTSQEIHQVDLGGAFLYGGDGLVLHDGRLYVVRGGLSPQNPRPQVSVLRPAADWSAAEVESVIYSDFLHPSTARVVRGRLMVVNSQYNTGQTGGQPELPFSISAIPLG
ncbi:SMP-30/gluconolactonase/LRE family protein [Kribbella sp. CA-294648]|uniref:SMP-30/gluconolactonase/LRE family protein n=1 Tax=Kribbella sp. CA-294648 TaxID=3239948 RepID=UPI003D89C3BB